MAARRKPEETGRACAAPEDAVDAEAGAVEASGADAMEYLRSAVEEQLLRNADKIATALAERAARGDLNAAKICLLLIKEKPRPGRWRRRDAPSEAQRLADGPQWQDPVPDPDQDPVQDMDPDLDPGMDPDSLQGSSGVSSGEFSADGAGAGN
jgi:hypothetical protein